MELHVCHGPLFFGMRVYLSEMDRRMVGKLLLPYFLQSLVACKILVPFCPSFKLMIWYASLFSEIDV